MTNRNSSINVPEAHSVMDRFRIEAAGEAGVNLARDCSLDGTRVFGFTATMRPQKNAQ